MRQRLQPPNLSAHLVRRRAHRQASERKQPAPAISANGFKFIIHFRRPQGCFSGRQEIKPGIREAEDAGADVVRGHEGEFSGNGGVGGVDGAAMLGSGESGGSVGGEDYQARVW